MKFSLLSIGCVLFLIPALAHGEGPSSKIKTPDLGTLLPLLDAKSPEALEGVLRGMVLKHLPHPLFETNPGWGNQRMVAHALKWRKKGLFLRPEIHKTPRNHGTWRKIRVEANNPSNTLILDLRNIAFPDPGRMVFDVFLAFDARAYYWQENWNSGVRLYAGSVRARFRTNVSLKCEATAQFAPGKGFVPDAVFRFRVTQANLSYDNLVFEHVPGIGGDAAQILGQVAHGSINQWHPSLERGLLARASQSIVRAADTKEVRVSFSRVLNKAFGVGH